MPWKPKHPKEFPTLGWLIGEWIEEHLVIPSGPRTGEPFRLYKEQWNWLLRYYRLHVDAVEDDGSDAFLHIGGQLVRPQKWGKDPLMAAQLAAHGLGPVEFAGWDANGRPVGKPHPSPYMQCLATVKDQAMNTWMPLITMLESPALSDVVGLDAGETRVVFPNGKAHWTTSVSTSRLGQPLTYVTLTETHLMTEENGLADTARAVMRNVAGMGGRWMAGTNAWDPMEYSIAQQLYYDDSDDILHDYRKPTSRVIVDKEDPLYDEGALYREVIHVYGDSARTNGGHVSESRIVRDIQRGTTGEGNARRYFLNDTESGDRDPIDGNKWQELITDTELEEGARIGLGFDGSRSRDATALVAYNVDSQTVHVLNVWESPKVKNENRGKWNVPRDEVDRAVRDAFNKYKVGIMFADPYYWDEYLDRWTMDLERVADFPTNKEQRMDQAIERFLSSVKNGELYHTNDEILNRHIANSVLKDGKRKPPRNDFGFPEFYQVIRKKKEGHYIDVFIAAILAVHAGGYALEKDLFPEDDKVATPFLLEM